MFCLNRRYRPFTGARAPGARLRQRREPRVLERFPRLGLRTPSVHEEARAAKARAAARHPEHRQRRGAAARARQDRAADRPAAARHADLLHGVRLPDAAPRSVPGRLVSSAQAEYVNEAEFIAWRHPRVFSHAQFQLYDVPPRTEFPRDTPAYWATYQSGLFTALPEGAPKPARERVQVRPRRPAPGRDRADLGPGEVRAERRDVPGRASGARARARPTWVRSGDLVQVTHSQGYFRARRPHAARLDLARGLGRARLRPHSRSRAKPSRARRA